MSTRPTPVLGRLEEVDLRSVWSSEPYDFTPWLADASNLQFLADSLELPGLELVRTEHPVDSFSADIVCKIVGTEQFVLIENQLERTDHVHLGQLLTYAAKFDAQAVVWVARSFTDAHRAAIDWLNRITAKEYALFGVEVRAVRIANSLPAPLFDVVARPNDWTKPQAIAAPSDGSPTEQNADNVEYWFALDQKLETDGVLQRRSKKAVKGQNLWIPLTNDGAVYIVVYRAFSNPAQVGAYIGIYGDNRKTYWDRLNLARSQIDLQFGSALRWEENRTGSVYKVIPDPLLITPETSDRQNQLDWLVSRINQLAEVFRDPIQGNDRPADELEGLV